MDFLRRYYLLVLTIFSMPALPGCSSAPKTYAKLEPKKAIQVAPYAMMAANSYHRRGERFPVEVLGWEQVKRTGELTSEPTYAHRFSLAYDIYRHRDGKHYAYVYRGTDSVLDFPWANFAIFVSPQYEKGKREFEQFLKAHPPTKYKIVTVGHSLGGGLAFRDSVLHGVDALAFDPSPRLFAPKVKHFASAKREVVFQKGEILSSLRSRTSAWYLATKDGKVYQVDFDFGPELQRKHGIVKWVGLHSMTKLAEEIVREGAKADPKLLNVALPRR